MEGKQYHEGFQDGGGYSVRRRHTISTVEGIQQGCVTPSVRRRRIVNTDEAHRQHGGGCGVRCRVCSTDLSHYQYGQRCAVRMSHIISTDKGVQYRTTETAQGAIGGCIYLGKMIIYRQSYYNLDFILPWLDPYVAEIPLGCQYDYIWIP